MRNDNNGGAAFPLILFDTPQYFPSGSRIKTCRGLVKHQHLGAHGDDTRQRRTALLSARQIEGRLFQKALVKSRKAGGFTHRLFDLVLAHTHIAGAESNILFRALVKKLIFGVLHHKSHPKADIPYFLRLFPYINAVQKDFSAVRLHKSVEHLHQSGFAAARVTDKARNAPGFKNKIYAVQRLYFIGRALAVGV